MSGTTLRCNSNGALAEMIGTPNSVTCAGGVIGLSAVIEDAVVDWLVPRMRSLENRRGIAPRELQSYAYAERDNIWDATSLPCPSNRTIPPLLAISTI